MLALSNIGRCAGRVNLAEGDLLIALRAYLDSSGKPQFKRRHLTLAAVAANDEMWAEFETAWAKILAEHKPKADYVHMREIVQMCDGFDPKYGWDQQSAFDVANQCVQYMSHLDKKRFRMSYCSVDLDAWRKLRAETYQMPEPVDICNRFCSELVLGWYLNYYPEIINPHVDTVSYFFDRTEDFKKPFEEKWNREKDFAEQTGERSVWQIIDKVASVEMKKTPGVQAADIIAWARNRETFTDEGDLGRYLAHIVRQVIPSFYIEWDEAKMREQFKPLIYLP